MDKLMTFVLNEELLEKCTWKIADVKIERCQSCDGYDETCSQYTPLLGDYSK